MLGRDLGGNLEQVLSVWVVAMSVRTTSSVFSTLCVGRVIFRVASHIRVCTNRLRADCQAVEVAVHVLSFDSWRSFLSS